MQTITINVRKGLDAVSEITDRPGIGAVLGMVERKRFNDGREVSTRYTPLGLDLEPLADPQLSSAAAVAILITNHQKGN